MIWYNKDLHDSDEIYNYALEEIKGNHLKFNAEQFVFYKERLEEFYKLPKIEEDEEEDEEDQFDKLGALVIQSELLSQGLE